MDLASTTSPGTAHGNRVIKVDHAGEHGAVCIYTAQILFARLTAPGLVEELVHFREHERAHRKIFEDELARRSHPRCRSYWLCGLGGFVLGAVTGLFGRRAIAATTVAIESVVLRHLRQQIAELSTEAPARSLRSPRSSRTKCTTTTSRPGMSTKAASGRACSRPWSRDRRRR